MSNEQALVAYLLASLIEQGGVVQVSPETLGEAVIRVVNGRFKLDLDDTPDGSIVIRLSDET